MPNIIEQIIEIDSIAQKRLNDADKIKVEIEKQVAQKTKETNALIDEKANARIAHIAEIEMQFTQDAKDKIKDETDKAIAKLDLAYEQNHEKLEEEIFQNIISLN